MVDWVRVQQLQEEIGKDEFAEVVMLFLEEADEVLARLSVQNGADILRDDCHFLKGSALNLGFATLAQLCNTAEKQARQGDCSVDLDALRQCYSASREGLLAGLAKLAA